MTKVRPADGIPVVPYIDDEIFARLDALHAKLQEAAPGLECEYLAWAAAHPVLNAHVSVLARVFRNLLHPATGGHSAADTAEAIRGVILNFKMALALMEMTESFLAEKH